MFEPKNTPTANWRGESSTFARSRKRNSKCLLAELLPPAKERLYWSSFQIGRIPSPVNGKILSTASHLTLVAPLPGSRRRRNWCCQWKSLYISSHHYWVVCLFRWILFHNRITLLCFSLIYFSIHWLLMDEVVSSFLIF